MFSVSNINKEMKLHHLYLEGVKPGGAAKGLLAVLSVIYHGLTKKGVSIEDISKKLIPLKSIQIERDELIRMGLDKLRGRVEAHKLSQFKGLSDQNSVRFEALYKTILEISNDDLAKAGGLTDAVGGWHSKWKAKYKEKEEKSIKAEDVGSAIKAEERFLTKIEAAAKKILQDIQEKKKTEKPAETPSETPAETPATPEPTKEPPASTSGEASAADLDTAVDL